MPRAASIPFIFTVTRKSYPRSKLAKKTKKVATTRNAKHKTLTSDKMSPQLAYFNQKHSAETQNVEKATSTYVAEHATKGNLTLSALGTPSLDHILTCDTAFEHLCLCLILYDYFSATDVENLNKTNKPFTHFHKMLSHRTQHSV